MNKKDLGYILEVTRDTSWGDGHCSSFDDSFLMSYFTTRDVRPPPDDAHRVQNSEKVALRCDVKGKKIQKC